MDLYIELEDLSESVYDCDITCEKLNENVSAALNNILNMSEDSWKGDAQFAFLEEFSKWVNNSNDFVTLNNLLADGKDVYDKKEWKYYRKAITEDCPKPYWRNI